MENIEAQASGLRAIYQSVYYILKNADRSQFSDIQKANLPMLDSSLDSPKIISFDKLVAVLKAIISHQEVDKIKLEYFYSVPSQQGKSVGQIVNEGLKGLGLRLKDLQSFVKEKGWIGE